MPPVAYDVASKDVHKTINSLIDNMVNIKDETGEFLLRLEDGRVIDTKGWQGWEWTHGIGLYGLYRYHALTGSEEALKVMEEWFANRFAEGGTWLESWAEYAMYELPRTKYGGMSHQTYNSINAQELWDDTLMMTVLPLTKIGLLLNRPHYVDESKRQFLLHIKYLFDTKTGLFYHGWTFEDGGHNFAKALWARGNSWLTIVIPEMLELLNLPANDPFRIHLIDTLEAQCRGLLEYQEDSGLWRTLIDQPLAEGSYVETSATAGFAFGMLKGLRMRFLQGEEFRESAIRAIKATLQHYKDIPRTSMPYGQAMAIMALGEFLRVYI